MKGRDMESGKHDKERCEAIFAMLSQYLDRELNAATCEEIEAHLAGCEPCIEFLNSLKRTVCLCHDCEAEEAPPPLTVEQRDQLAAAFKTYLAGKK